MATVEDAARGVVAALNGVPFLLASKWVADRYRQVFAKVRARHLRRIEQLYVPAALNAGTATFTRDNDVVTGDATAQAAWTPDVVGRYIRGSVAWYRIDALTVSGGSTALKIEKKYAEDTVAGASYYIVSRLNALPDDARWIGDAVVSMRTRRPLDRYSLDEMNIEFPARDRVGSQADSYCEGQDIVSTGRWVKSLEVYPYMQTSEVYAYVVYPQAPVLHLLDQLPPEIDEHVLREGAIVDAYRWMMANAIANGQVEQAAVWRNEFRTQETKWKEWMADAIRADKGVDDVTFILKSQGKTSVPYDTRTAYDMVLTRWPR